MIWNKQPEVKKNDIVLLIKVQSGLAGYEPWMNRPLRVVTVSSGTGNFIQVVSIDGTPNSSPINLYSNQMEWMPEKKKKIIELCKKRLKDVEKEKEMWETRLDFYENYENEDEYLAERIEQLITADPKKGKVKIIGELRKFFLDGGIFWNLK